MPLQFTVLASGSSGNTSLLVADGFGVLLDLGLGPRQLAARLNAAGYSWHHVHAAVLTHTHTDHWKDATLTHLARRRAPLYCHAGHVPGLRAYGSGAAALEAEGLLRLFDAGQELALAPGLHCCPFPVSHDGGPTFGFRFEGGRDLFGNGSAVGYAADLGTWTPAVAQALAEVDLLAVEFNHDVELQYRSGRSPRLIARVLGEFGHLSNDQGAALVREVLRRTEPGRLRHVVQLHLSRDCNRPALAAAAARLVLAQAGASLQLHTAGQDEPGPTLTLGAPVATPRPARPRPAPRRARRPQALARPWLPGLEFA